MEFLIICILVGIAGVANVLADLSAEGKIPWGDPYYWHKDLSSVRKYKDGTLEPRFFGSTTFLVFVTDAWHTFTFIRSSCLKAGICILLTGNWKEGVIFFLLLKLIYGGLGELIRRLI